MRIVMLTAVCAAAVQLVWQASGEGFDQLGDAVVSRPQLVAPDLEHTIAATAAAAGGEVGAVDVGHDGRAKYLAALATQARARRFEEELPLGVSGHLGAHLLSVLQAVVGVDVNEVAQRPAARLCGEEELPAVLAMFPPSVCSRSG